MNFVKPYIIGIAGGSASGKTSFLRDLKLEIPSESLAIISQDNYYFPKEQQFIDENGEINFDLPTSIDRVHFHDDLLSLIKVFRSRKRNIPLTIKKLHRKSLNLPRPQ